ncbi:hypothetical protein [Winogradskyella sp. R77965]|uniref:hypothetical protein n=1 Tax=Winogradskyella sp. R77965 TaxID=3093872 RepID=UPI0037DCE97E
MHDGSLDCCGTCWFNSNNRNQEEKKESKTVFCTIRNFKIHNGFTLFCANHPSYNSNMINVPIGSVFAKSGYGKPQEHKFLFHSPDNERIRTKLVKVLNEISVDYEFHKFSETLVNEELIKQLALFKEQRAIEGLLKIIAIDLDTIKDLKVQNRVIMLIGLSINALMEISQGEQLSMIEKFISRGLESFPEQAYNQQHDRFASIRYFTIESLKFSKSNKAIELLIKAQQDPNTYVNQLVLEILIEKFEIS